MSENNKPTPPGNEGPQGPMRNPNRPTRSLLIWVVIFGLGLLLLTVFNRSFEEGREISIVDFWTYVENGQVTGKIVVKEDVIEGENSASANVPADEPRKFYVSYNYQADEGFPERLNQALKRHDYPAKPTYPQRGIWSTILPQLLLWGLVFLAIWFFLFRRIGQAGGPGGFLGNFGRSKHRMMTRERVKITFDDVAGIREAKDDVMEIIEFLRDPKKFQRLGGRVPRGVLLIGEPGCGKTLLAKAIAGEAEVPFFSISGSDFVEMFVGVGASRVRDLFKQAKDASPCIIFLDEIDAVGRRRGVGFTGGGGHDEREQTLNAILVEMDGFESSDQVIVIAATNRGDVLDPALTRPGRFDRQISVPLPDLQGRMDILNIYINRVKCSPDVDLRRIARGTPMFSGADLEALVNEAAIEATMAGKDAIDQDDLEEARDKVRWGRARKSRVIDEKEKRETAFHEAGHALVQVLEEDADPLHKVSIIPRGPAGGATFSLPEKDRYFYTRNYCKAMMAVALGGRVAEEVFCGDISSGAAGDIAQVTTLARKMILDWGMSEKLGFVRYTADEQGRFFPSTEKEYSERTAEVIDEEIRNLIDEADRRTRQRIQDNRQALEAIAEALLKYETLTGEEVKDILAGRTLNKPTVDELLSLEDAKPHPAEGVTHSPPVPGDDSESGTGPAPMPEPN